MLEDDDFNDALKEAVEEGLSAEAALLQTAGQFEDMFLSMDRWHEPETIFRLARIVCMRRENESEKGELLFKKAEEYRIKGELLTARLVL